MWWLLLTQLPDTRVRYDVVLEIELSCQLKFSSWPEPMFLRALPPSTAALGPTVGQ
jgi:hypothetical protein